MNPSASIPFAQMILSWILLGVLLVWMLVFAFLAFRPRRIEMLDLSDLPTPSGSFPMIVPLTPLSFSNAPVEVAVGNASMMSSDQSGDVGAAPVV